MTTIYRHTNNFVTWPRLEVGKVYVVKEATGDSYYFEEIEVEELEWPMTQLVLKGGCLVDFAKAVVIREDITYSLTRHEWSLLKQLAVRPGLVHSNTELLTACWGSEWKEDLQYLRVWVSRLRSKLGMDAISTVNGIGYILNLEEGAS